MLPLSRQIAGLVGWLAATFVTAAFGAVASASAGTFYGELARPAWAPPGTVFGPVWMLLYTMMGVAAWLVWREGGFRPARAALSLFLAQLFFNGLWSWLFFAWHRGAWAFADIVVLGLLIAATTLAFWKTRPLAGALMAPYLIWVGFAAALNYSVWQLNPGLL